MDILRNERTGQAPQGETQRVTNENPYTTLGKDTEFEGTLKFKEGLKIEGRFKGDITSEGNLIIGKTGEVNAEIKVGSIIVEGKINGNIEASDLIEFRSTAEMRGDIKASKLKIEEGVVFVGKSDVQAARGGGGSPQQQQPQKQGDQKQDDKKGGGGGNK